MAVGREFIFQIIGDDLDFRQVLACGHAYHEEAHSVFNHCNQGDPSG